MARQSMQDFSTTDFVIDDFIEHSKALNGQLITERRPWNTEVNADSIRHFAFGTSDDNPLWLDPDYASKSEYGELIAPPAFVCSVLYPFVHGSPMVVPLTNLIGEIEMEWFRLIRCGDQLYASVRQVDVDDALDRQGQRIVLITAETTYRNQNQEVVAKALGTMVRIARKGNALLINRDIYSYDERQRGAIQKAIESWRRAGSLSPSARDIWVGMQLPSFVRGPLSLGDLICWEAAIGPSYRAGALGYKDSLASPHTTAINPVTGWPLKYSQQHEDFLLAGQRGMPAPFDNSLMRFAWLAPMLTDWIGDSGVLRKLKVQTSAPVLYGDTTWYSGTVTSKHEINDERTQVSVRINGINQLGEDTTSADAILEVSKQPRKRQTTDRIEFEMGGNTQKGLIERFHAHVFKRQEALAVATRQRSFSITELDALSSRGASNLMKRGIGTGSLVGHLFSRNFDSIAAILAVMKAGAAFLPLPIDTSPERLQLLIDAARPQAVLYDDGLDALSVLSTSESRHENIQWHSLCVEGQTGHFKPVRPRPTDLAYVMPTSGSLGTPRLVAVSQNALCLYLDALEPCLGIGKRDRCLHTASFYFSASIRQLFACLCSGGCIVLADDDERRDMVGLMTLIKDLGVTVWDTVPSVWQNCIDTLHLLPPVQRSRLLENQLRLVCSTGETLRWKTARMWREVLRHPSEIINLYSQTETAGSVCSFAIEDIPKHRDDQAVPLGKPLSNVYIELLESDLKPAAAGQTGEICVRGPRLASGYLGLPEETAKRFSQIPFNNEGFYRTGDLGRIGPSGELEYRGRSDLRVKIRGQRIELEAIESALLQHPEVKQALAICYEEHPGSPFLVAYIVFHNPEAAPSKINLRNFLRPIVGDASLPSRIVHLSHMPLNASGKADRSALSPPKSLKDAPPKTNDSSISAVVRGFFMEALEISSIDDYENFFNLGGNSLMASRILTRIREHFMINLSIRKFFDTPSIEALSLEVKKELLCQIEELTEEEASTLFEKNDGHLKEN